LWILVKSRLVIADMPLVACRGHHTLAPAMNRLRCSANPS
jgi:hypothetical protein